MAGTTPNLELPYPDLTEPADVPLDIKQLAEALDQLLPATTADWTPATLLNGWANGGPEVGAYLKDALGFVHLKGRFASAGVGPSGSVVFTLPAGYRPGGDSTYAAVSFINVTPGICAVQVRRNTGNIEVYYTAGHNDVSISGVKFLAEA